MKHHIILTTFAVSGLFVFNAAAQQDQANRIRQAADESFVTKATQGGMAEVELGRLATQKAANEKVKQFGQRMVDDHSKANDELNGIVARKGMTAPTALDSASESTKTRLSRLNGAEFDRAYMEEMVSGHKQAIALFQREADHGADPDIKAFASRTLPIIQHHLQLAEETLNAVKR
jgi:putative membrane protein